MLAKRSATMPQWQRLARMQQVVYIEFMKALFRLVLPILGSLLVRKLLRRARK